jgi:hypothetical protein
MVDIYTWAVLILSTLTTFGLYMILSGVDNPWFAFAEHAFVGCAIGLSVVVSTDYIFRTIVPRIMTDPGKNWPTFISIILGLMMLLRVYKGTVHIARIPITIATGAGIAVGTRATLFSGIINQIRATILPIFTVTDTWTLMYNLTVIMRAVRVHLLLLHDGDEGASEERELRGKVHTVLVLRRPVLPDLHGQAGAPPRPPGELPDALLP